MVNKDSHLQSQSSNERLTPAISLPKGGGAIAGMGEKFKTNPVTGTASFSIPVKLSPGRNKFTPDLSVNYDSGNSNGPFGLGWNLSQASITRKTQKGLPKYNDATESDTFLIAGAEDLVPFLVLKKGKWERRITSQDNFIIYQYRPRTEGLFSKIERWYNSETSVSHWKVISKDNTTTIFGSGEGARISDPADPTKVFEWLPEKTYDDKGNCIVYEYKKENQQNISSQNIYEGQRLKFNSCFSNLYLKKVKYGNTIPVNRRDGFIDPANAWLFELVLDYGEHGETAPGYLEKSTWPCRQDPFSGFRSGFEIRTYRLCKRLLMFHRFKELGKEPYLVASTNLTYEENPVATFLTSAQYWSYQKGKEPAPFPPLAFTYSKPGTQEKEFVSATVKKDELPGGIDGSDLSWTDLFGEGIPGLLYQDRQSWWYMKNRSEAQNDTVVFNPFEKVAQMPSLAGKQKNTAQLMDLDGDGTLELLVQSNGLSGFFEHEEETWKNFRSFNDVPNINWQDPNLKMIDLTGDGHADILITEENCFTWYASKIKEGYGSPERVVKAIDENHGPTLLFNDTTQSVYLSDMSGGGLTDVVRIRNGEVCYWPNLGYGKFGAKIILENSPFFDHPDQFNQKRIRLVDIDGSGTTDLLYIYQNEIKYWINQSGNGFAAPRSLTHDFTFDNLSQIQTIDLFGKGTACVVFSHPMFSEQRYIDLMPGGKPYLLKEINNNMGTLTRFQYAASTKFYLQDEKNGKPWITKLSFPVQVVEKTELIDEIENNRFITRYAYHHGYYDGVEREFRGFGMVEQWDTESYEEHLQLTSDKISEELFVPPVYTKTWFHTGFLFDKQKILNQYEKEYYQDDREAWRLGEGDLSQELSTEELRQAARAFKGSVLRQEVYAEDGTEKAKHPYSVTTNNYSVRKIQPAGESKFAVFMVMPNETLTYHYERNPEDPRIGHEMTLDVDDFGNVTESLNIAYPRRKPLYPEQGQLAMVLKVGDVVNVPDEADFYRLGINYQSTEYEVTGIPFVEKKFEAGSMRELLQTAVEISYEEKAGKAITRRILSEERILFYDENLKTSLPLGEIALHAFPYCSYSKSFTPELLELLFGDKVTERLLGENGYVRIGKNWWRPSERLVFNPLLFYQIEKVIDPFGNISKTEFDKYSLFPLSTIDAIGNRSSAVYDYRVLSAKSMIDINGNKQEVSFDTRGKVTASAINGKKKEGDTLMNPTSHMEYELFNWMLNGEPNYSHSYSREDHKKTDSRWQQTRVYSNGFGKEILGKVLVEFGLAFARNKDFTLKKDKVGNLVQETIQERWIGNGRTILNNKGKPVRKYEPYFSSTPGYENDTELREYGVSSLSHYDPLGRVIRTDMPDATFSLTLFDPWQQTTYDQNDTVLDSAWYSKRFQSTPDPEFVLSGKDPAKEREAALKAALNANTPTTHYFDSLGRAFLISLNNGKDKKGNDVLYQTKRKTDIKGKILSVTDSRENTIMSFSYDMHGNAMYSRSADIGRRWIFSDVLNKPLRMWDERKHEFGFNYDRLRRPTGKWVKGGDGPVPLDNLIEKITYGEGRTNDKSLNLRGKAVIVYDTAGKTEVIKFDFKGNPLQTETRFTKKYKDIVNWKTTRPDNKLEAEIFTNSQTFNALNRPITQTSADGSIYVPTYNQGGLVEKVKVIQNGQEQWYVLKIRYNEKRQREKVIFGNEVSANYFYDKNTFRTTHFETKKKNSNFLQNLYYTYDPVGNITHIEDKSSPTIFFDNQKIKSTAAYTYDAIYRLVEATGREHIAQTTFGTPDNWNDLPFLKKYSAGDSLPMRNYRQLYEYDEAGNIKTMKHVAAKGNWTRTYKYNENNNRLISTNVEENDTATNSYTYPHHSSHGYITSLPHLQLMNWNFLEQLQAVAKQKTRNGIPETTYYTYNGAGQRVRKITEWDSNTKKHSPEKKSQRIYLGNVEIYNSYDRKGVSQLKRTTYSVTEGAKRLAMIEARNEGMDEGAQRLVRYQFANHLGSVNLETDDTIEAKVISYEEFHPFGTTSYQAVDKDIKGANKRYRYTGKERDEESGLEYHGARYYMPWLGRWLNPDPIGIKGGLNLYAYVNNNPVMLHDPMGTSGVDSCDQWLRPEEKVCLMGDDTYSINLFKIESKVTNSSSSPVKTADQPSPEKPKTDINVGGAGVVVNYISPEGFTLVVPDIFESSLVKDLTQGAWEGEVGRNAGTDSPTWKRRQERGQKRGLKDFKNMVPKPLFEAPGGKGWAADHIRPMQYDLTGKHGYSRFDYEWKDAATNSLEGTKGYNLQKNNPFMSSAGGIAKESTSLRFYNTEGYRTSLRRIGNAGTVLGAGQSLYNIYDAFQTGLQEGTAVSSTLTATAQEAGGWTGAWAGGVFGAEIGLFCGEFAPICSPVFGFVLGGVGYVGGVEAVNEVKNSIPNIPEAYGNIESFIYQAYGVSF